MRSILYCIEEIPAILHSERCFVIFYLSFLIPRVVDGGSKTQCTTKERRLFTTLGVLQSPASPHSILRVACFRFRTPYANA